MNDSARRIQEQGGEEETDLVRAAQGGDQGAFAELLRRYRGPIYRICFGLTRSHEDADDLAQETFVRAYQALARFRLGEPLLPWLSRIAINQSFSLHRRRRRRPETSMEALAEGGSDWGVEDDPAEHAASADERRLLLEAFGQISPEHQAVLVLRVEREMSYEEIAEALRVPVGTVMSRLSRARADLKRRIVERRGEESR